MISLKRSRNFPTLSCQTLNCGRTQGLLSADLLYAFRVPPIDPMALTLLAGLYKAACRHACTLCVQAGFSPPPPVEPRRRLCIHIPHFRHPNPKSYPNLNLFNE